MKVVVTVASSTAGSGSTTIYTATVTSTTYYELTDNGDGTYTVVSELTGENALSTNSDGTAIFLFTNSYASSTDITLKKVSDDETPVALADATFTLIAFGATEGTSYITGENGTVTMTGLSDGTYTLTETNAPDGYNLLTSDITLKISGGKVTSATYGTDSSSSVVSVSEDGLTITVVNTAGYVLPSTGGSGTWLYTLTGTVLCCGAALVLWKRRVVTD